MSGHDACQCDFADHPVASVSHKERFRHRFINDAARHVKQSRDAAAILVASGVRFAGECGDNSRRGDLADGVIATVHDIQVAHRIKAQRAGLIESRSRANGVDVANLISRSSKGAHHSQRGDFADRGIAGVGHIQVAQRIKCEPFRGFKRSRRASAIALTCHGRGSCKSADSVVGHFADQMVTRVGEKAVAICEHGDAARSVEECVSHAAVEEA